MSQQPEQQPGPPITDEMREQARETPNSWLYIIDPGYEESGENVGTEGVVGAYRIDSDGEVQEFHHNDEYVPSMPPFEPTNELERVLNRIATGQAEETELPPAVLDAEVLLYATEEEPDAVYAAEMTDGSQLVPACTSADRVPQQWPGYRTVAGTALPELLDGFDLGLNLDDAIRAVVPHRVLVEAASDRG